MADECIKWDEIIALPLPPGLWNLVHTVLPDLPIDRIWATGRYGDCRCKKDRKTGEWKKTYHWGIDVQGKGADKGYGTRVCSPLDGWVVGLEGGGGWGAIRIVDRYGNYAILGHMCLYSYEGIRYVNVGDRVAFGQTVGLLSDEGSRGAYHLHLTVGYVYENGYSRRNPLGSWAELWETSYGLSPVGYPDVSGRCLIDRANRPFSEAKKCRPPRKKDPILLDLDGDGITTINVKDGDYFDYQGDGFAELTGWVDPKDGLLAIDRNGDGIISDGKELFGDQTILKDGTRAANGFQALAEFDSNNDGKIDANDPAFAQLRVWTDLDGDEYLSPTELCPLHELSIKSIGLDSTIAGTSDSHGNMPLRVGSFEKLDGTSGQVAEYSLQRDTIHTVASEWLDVPEHIASLPDLPGYGNVYELHQAMVRDASGALKSLVEQFVSETDLNSRNSLTDRILLKWTGSESVHPQSRGNNIDARKLAVLEKFFGESFVGENGPNPSHAASVLLNESYRRLFEMTYGQLMAQTHLKDLYKKITWTQSDQTQETKLDLAPAITDLEECLSGNPEQGKQILAEFARSLRGVPTVPENDYLALRDAFTQRDPALGWVFDTGGLPVYDQLGQGDGWYYPHMWGTWNADAVRGSATEGDGFINGLDGDDAIYGTSRDEVLINGTGDAILVAGGGNDTIWAGDGNDIVDGGEGNDQLLGEAGNDTYIFRRSSGQDVIIDPDPTPDNVDTIWLGGNLTPEDVVLRRSGDNLVLKIADTTDTLTVQDFFRNDSTLNRVEQIQFMDGTVWTYADMISETYTPTEGDDVIYDTIALDSLSGLAGNDILYGLAGNDTLHGDEGDDKLYGGPGDDTMDGGTQNDVLDGGTGNDTYLFGRASGHDEIVDYDATPGNMDTLRFSPGVLPTDIRVEWIGNDLKFTITDTGDSVAVKNWLDGSTVVNGIELVAFEDGTVSDTDRMKEMLLLGTSGERLGLGSLFLDFRVGAGCGVSALPTLLCTTFFFLTRDELSGTDSVGEKPHGFLPQPIIDQVLRQRTLCPG